MRFSVAALSAALGLSLSACGGGGSSNLPRSAPVGSSSAAATEALWDSQHPPQATPVPVSNDLLYIGNIGANSITVYHHDAQGNTAPLKVIKGPNTGINAPGQLSEDAQGNLYVANGSLYAHSSAPGVLVFAHGANGNVAPIRRINAVPGLPVVQGVTVDLSTGKIFIYEGNGAPAYPTALRYPPNATIGTAPFASSLSFWPAFQLASDSTGRNIIEAHYADSPNSEGFGVATLQKQYYNGVPPAILYNTLWFSAQGVADDPTTKTYLQTMNGQGGGIYRLAEDTVGNGPGAPVRGETLNPLPISVITSDTCGSQLALGYLRNIYVTHSTKIGRCSTDAVYVYTHDAAGAAAPLRVLSGSATLLDEPYGIYEGP